MYPVTPMLSVAAIADIGTVSVLEVDGMVKTVTVGAVVSAVPEEDGWLVGSLGFVPALISTIFVDLSLSESNGSIVLKLKPALRKAVP